MNGRTVQQFAGESRDGRGAADHDVPYMFGRLPTVTAPFPFSLRELARLMVLRSQVRDGLLTGDRARGAR